MSRTKQIRLRAGYSQTKAAALANVAPWTWRVYEVDADAVTEPKRRLCDAATLKMAKQIGEHAA